MLNVNTREYLHSGASSVVIANPGISWFLGKLYKERESKHFLGQGAKDWANMGLMALSGSLKEKETITVEDCEV